MSSFENSEASHTEKVVSAVDVIEKRQIELLYAHDHVYKELEEIEDQQKALELRKSELFVRLKEIELEGQILDSVNANRLIYTENTLVIEQHDGAKIYSNRLDFESSIRKIFEMAGRPIRMCELIEQLKKFGFVWKSYRSAHRFISESKIIEKIVAPHKIAVYKYRHY